MAPKTKAEELVYLYGVGGFKKTKTLKGIGGRWKKFAPE